MFMTVPIEDRDKGLIHARLAFLLFFTISMKTIITFNRQMQRIYPEYVEMIHPRKLFIGFWLYRIESFTFENENGHECKI